MTCGSYGSCIYLAAIHASTQTYTTRKVFTRLKGICFQISTFFVTRICSQRVIQTANMWQLWQLHQSCSNLCFNANIYDKKSLRTTNRAIVIISKIHRHASRIHASLFPARLAVNKVKIQTDLEKFKGYLHCFFTNDLYDEKGRIF